MTVRRLAFGLFAIALFVRGAVCFSNLQTYSSDPDAYRAIADGLDQTGTFGLVDPDGVARPTAFRPPLYPYLLSWFFRDGILPLVSVAILHTILGAITVLLTFWATLRLSSSTGGRITRVAILASLLVLVDPILLQQSRLVMTETLATALSILLIGCWAVAIRSNTLRSAAILGAVMVLAYFCRPTFLAWAGLLCLGWIVFKIRERNQRAWMQFACTFGILAACVGAWTIRNAQAVGHPVWATSHGGYTLLLANNESFYTYLREGQWGERWDSVSFERAYLHRFDADPRLAEFWKRDWKGPSAIERGEVTDVTEIEDDQLAYEAAMATIRRAPEMFAWSCVVRVLRLWSPFPHATDGRPGWINVAVSAWYLVILCCVCVGAIRIYRSPTFAWDRWWSVLTLLFTLSVVHAVYWSNMRMRAPAIPALSILAAAAFATKKQEAIDVANA
ncbi:MAG: hypothetical protein AAGI63_07475 [Planctomycetota bacterium]